MKVIDLWIAYATFIQRLYKVNADLMNVVCMCFLLLGDIFYIIYFRNSSGKLFGPVDFGGNAFDDELSFFDKYKVFTFSVLS